MPRNLHYNVANFDIIHFNPLVFFFFYIVLKNARCVKNARSVKKTYKYQRLICKGDICCV
ncbi:hypothetical protein C1646_686514 [Rhizophagus diaphanus]|nr:hypothetical protein C1646_686514 [Rhizophagus diaphanus] [Rhizophagus sp. MUCL 43196]